MASEGGERLGRDRRTWHHEDVYIGPAIIVFVLIVAIPVGVLITGGVLAGILGTFLRSDADARYEGTEYVELGR